MLSNFRSLLERPGARAAADNLGWLIAERAARLVLNVGVGFWVARYLGPAQFGTLSFAMALVGMAALFAELGLDSIVRRTLIRAPDDAAGLIATAWGLRLIGGVFAYIVLLAGAWLGGASTEDRALLAVLGLTLFQPALFVVDLWFQARLRAKFSVLAQSLALLAGAAVRVGLILSQASLTGFAWAAVVEMLIAAGILYVLVRKDGLRWRPALFARAKAAQLLVEAWPLILSGFAVVLYLRIDAVMLRAIAGEAAVGIYAAATRFTEIWFFVPIALASSLLPSLLRARARGADAYHRRLQAFYDLNAGIAYAVAAPLALAAPWIIAVAYGAAYAPAAPVLALHVWSSVFVFLGVARGQFLVNEGHTRFYLAATVAGLTTNVVLNALLIPQAGELGAAAATVVSQSVASWLTSFCFAPIRPNARMQTLALLIPLRWPAYVQRT